MELHIIPFSIFFFFFLVEVLLLYKVVLSIIPSIPVEGSKIYRHKHTHTEKQAMETYYIIHVNYRCV